MIEHLSFSNITTYMNCPRAWKFKYIEKKPTRSSSALAFGSAFHGTIERYLQRSADVDIQSIWAEEWTKQCERATLDLGDTPESMMNEGIRMFSSSKIMYEINAIPTPQFIELPVSMTVPGVPVPVIGYIDMVSADGTLADFKTAKARWPEDKAKNSLQPVFYLAAMKQMGITAPMTFRHYVFTKTKEPAVQIINTEFRPSQFLFLFSLIQNVWKSIEAGAFHECPDGWMCSETYCDYWKSCRGRFA